MDELIFNGITTYYKALSKLGYYKYQDVFRLMVLCFYRDFTLNDYRGILSIEDYHEIELALNCLFGTNCLIPYPDYLKMGKLHIGQMTEIAQRLSDMENEVVLKPRDFSNEDFSNVRVIAVDEKEVTYGEVQGNSQHGA